MIITVTANPLLDHLVNADVLPGQVVRTPRFTRIAGGKGLNVARVLVRHGHPVRALGFAGGDAGRRLVELVQSDGVEPYFTTIADETRIGFLAVASAGGNTSLLETGPQVSQREQYDFIDTLREQVVHAALVLVGGAPPAGCEGLYAAICAVCAAEGVPCWMDGYGPAQSAAMACSTPPQLAKPNRQELSAGGDWNRVAELHISDGAGALQVRTGATSWQVQPPTVPEVNAVGSGDCYLAALAHARLAGWDLERQLAYAAAAGAANARVAEVACIGPDDIAPLVGSVRITAA